MHSHVIILTLTRSGYQEFGQDITTVHSHPLLHDVELIGSFLSVWAFCLYELKSPGVFHVTLICSCECIDVWQKLHTRSSSLLFTVNFLNVWGFCFICGFQSNFDALMDVTCIENFKVLFTLKNYPTWCNLMLVLPVSLYFSLFLFRFFFS